MVPFFQLQDQEKTYVMRFIDDISMPLWIYDLALLLTLRRVKNLLFVGCVDSATVPRI